MFNRIIFLILGIVFLILGLVGLAIPIVPQIPFFVVSIILLSASSERINRWVVSTRIYKEHLQSRVEKSPLLTRLMEPDLIKEDEPMISQCTAIGQNDPDDNVQPPE